MIGKQHLGRGFRGVLVYILNPEKGRLIGGNMAGSCIDELAKEFSLSQRLNPRLNKPVFHASLSLAVGEDLSDELWQEVADRYIREMGFELSQYCVSRHGDTEHQHIHIVASRISLTGKTVSDSNNYRRSEATIRGIEKAFGLAQVRSSFEADRRALKSGELRKILKTQKPSARLLLQTVIDEEVKRSMTFSQLVQNLIYRSIAVIPNKAANGTISGLSYCMDGEKMKGSNLGKAYTFIGLQKRGIHFEPFRDLGTLEDSVQVMNVVAQGVLETERSRAHIR